MTYISKNFLAPLLTILGLSALSGVSYADGNPYIHNPAATSSPTETVEKSENCLSSKPFDSLIGEKVIFLQQMKQLQSSGYQLFHWANKPSSKIEYKDLVGKVGVITEIQSRSGSSVDFRKVLIKLDGTGELVTTNALKSGISSVVQLSDIEDGRKQWVGKTLWNKFGQVKTESDSSPRSWVHVKKYQPVKIVDVALGAEFDGGIDFVVQFPDGKQGFIGTSLSASNKSPDSVEALKKLFGAECSFDRSFLTQDPRLKYSWPAEDWSHLENSEVVVGMNVEQVKFALGLPKNVNVTKVSGAETHQWVYGESQYVYFDENGKVTAVQN